MITITAAITICSNEGNDTSSYLRQDETGQAGCIEFQALNTKITTLSLGTTLPSTSLFIDYPCPAFGIVVTPLTREYTDPIDISYPRLSNFIVTASSKNIRSAYRQVRHDLRPIYSFGRFIRVTNRKNISMKISSKDLICLLFPIINWNN